MPINDFYDEDRDYQELEAASDRWTTPEGWNTHTRLLYNILGERTFGNIFYDGAVISGLRILRRADDASVLDVLPGYIFVAGRIWPVDQTSISGFDPTKSSGLDYVYANWQLERITHLTDTDLQDQRSGEPAWNALRFSCSISRIDRSGVPVSGNVIRKNTTPIIVKVWDRSTGNIFSPQNTGQEIDIAAKLKLNQLSGSLDARRMENLSRNVEFNRALNELDFDVHGSYVIDGFEVQRGYNQQADAPSGQLAFMINAGKARVYGKLVETESPTRKYVDDASSHGVIEIVGETHSAFGTNSDYTAATGKTNKFYPLGKFQEGGHYVQEITDFSSTWMEVDIPMSYNVNDGDTSHHLIGSNFAIPSVSLLCNEIYYYSGGPQTGSLGVDYELLGGPESSQCYVNWLAGGPPAITPNYVLPFCKGTSFQEERDYRLYQHGYISFDGGSHSPATSFDVTYTVKPPRYDLVVLRPHERLYAAGHNQLYGYPVSNGTISIKEGIPALNPSVPDDPGGAMSIGHLIISPWGNHGVKKYYKDAMPQQELRLLEKRVATLEKNVSRESVARIGAEQSIGSLSLPEGTIYEGVVDDSVMDGTYADNTYSFDACLDFFTNDLILPYENFAQNTLSITPGSNPTVTPYRSILTMTPAGTESLVTQNQWSSFVSLDPYENYSQVGPFVRAYPQMDFWYNTPRLNDTERRNLQRAGHLKHYEVDGTERYAYDYIQSVNSRFCRELNILIEGWGFGSGEDNILVEMDNVQCVAGVQSIGTYGTNTGTVQADAYGHFLGHFTISGGVGTLGTPFGAKGITAVGDNDNEAESVYRVMSHLDASYEGKVVTYPGIHNMCQIFYNEFECILGEVHIGFNQIDSGNEPITIALCGIKNERPGGDIYWQTTMVPSDFNGTFPGLERIVMNNPVYLKEGTKYGILLITSSEEYHVQKAVLGEVGNNPQETIRNKPYANGVFLVSENGFNWYVREEEDLRFLLAKQQYGSLSTLEFDSLTGLDDLVSFYFGPNEFIPSGADIVWEYKIGGGTYIEFIPHTIVETGVATPQTSIQIKATLTSDNVNLSPMINGIASLSGAVTTIPIETWMYKEDGIYIPKIKILPNVTINHIGGTFEVPPDEDSQITISFRMEDGTDDSWTAVAAKSGTTAATFVRTQPDGFHLYRWNSLLPMNKRGHVIRFSLKLERPVSDYSLKRVRRITFFAVQASTVSTPKG